MGLNTGAPRSDPLNDFLNALLSDPLNALLSYSLRVLLSSSLICSTVLNVKSSKIVMVYSRDAYSGINLRKKA